MSNLDEVDVASDDEQDGEESHQVITQYGRRKPVILHVSNYFNTHSIASTALLHKLVASCVLPAEVGGKNGIAVYIDCTESFEPDLLIEFMINHLSKIEPAGSEEVITEAEIVPDGADVEPDNNQQELQGFQAIATTEADSGIESGEELKGDLGEAELQEEEPKAAESNPQEQMAELAVQHVHVFECDSSISVLGTLRQLPEYLMNVKLHHSGERLLRFVCICGIDNFLWLEKEAMEMARLEDGKSIASTSRSESLSSRILKELRAVQARFECPLAVYSTINTPGPDDLNTEDVPRDEQSETSSLFNIYMHSALLTLQPSQKPHLSTIPRIFEGSSGRRDNQAGVPYIREFSFKPYLGGVSALGHRTGVEQEALSQLGLRVMLDEDNQFAFDM